MAAALVAAAVGGCADIPVTDGSVDATPSDTTDRAVAEPDVSGPSDPCEGVRQSLTQLGQPWCAGGDLVAEFGAAGVDARCWFSATVDECSEPEHCWAGECRLPPPAHGFPFAAGVLTDLRWDPIEPGGLHSLLNALSYFSGPSGEGHGDPNALLMGGALSIAIDAHLEPGSERADVFTGYPAQLPLAMDGSDEVWLQPLSWRAPGVPAGVFPVSDSERGRLSTDPSELDVAFRLDQETVRIQMRQARMQLELEEGVPVAGALQAAIPFGDLVEYVNQWLAAGCDFAGWPEVPFVLIKSDKAKCTAEMNAWWVEVPPEYEGTACHHVAANKGLLCTLVGIIEPDVDTTGSGEADAMSVAVVFDAVPATLVGVGRDLVISACTECVDDLPVDPWGLGDVDLRCWPSEPIMLCDSSRHAGSRTSVDLLWLALVLVWCRRRTRLV